MPSYKRSRFLRIASAGKSVGDWITFVNLVVQAQTDTDADGMVEVELPFEANIHNLSVVGEDGTGNTAVSVGDFVYRDGAAWNADDANGVKFGIAIGSVLSGATTSIDVLQVSP